MIMNIAYYNIFYEVAINKNITLAAKKLNMSQPSVSRYISLLEHQANRKLFFRSKQGVKLTPEGVMLFNYISKGMEYIKKAEHELKIIKDEQNLELNLAVSQLTIKSILPPIIEKYKKNNPAIKIKLTTSSSEQAIANLLSGIVNMAIIPSPIESNPLLKVHKLIRCRSILIGGEKYKFLMNEKISLSNLNSYHMITLSPGTAGRKYLDNIFSSYKELLIPEIEVPSSDLIPPLVEYNLGLGIVSDIFARKQLEEGRVFKIDLKEDLPDRYFLLCLNRFHNLLPYEKIFTETIMSELGHQKYL